MLRGLRHRQQTAIVGGFGGDLLRHDQRMFRVDRRLHVVGRSMAAPHAHEACFRLGMALQLLQRCRHHTGVDGDSVLLVGRLHLIEIALHRLALAYPVGAADRAELRAVDGHPLAAHQSH